MVSFAHWPKAETSVSWSHRQAYRGQVRAPAQGRDVRQLLALVQAYRGQVMAQAQGRGVRLRNIGQGELLQVGALGQGPEVPQLPTAGQGERMQVGALDQGRDVPQVRTR